MKYFILLVTILISTIKSYSQDTTKIIIELDPPVEEVEVEPQFPGGTNAMNVFIQKNVVYPDSAKIKNEQGTIYVQFEVDTVGSISNIKVLKGVSPLIDTEAIRVIKVMPNWIPAQRAGQAVRSRYVLPIRFKL